MEKTPQTLNQPICKSESILESYKLPILINQNATPLAEAEIEKISKTLSESENRDQEPLQKYQVIKKGIMDFLENLHYNNNNIGYKNNAESFPYHKKLLFHIDTFIKRADLILRPALEAGIISLDVAAAQLLAIAGHDIIQDNRDLKQFGLSEKGYDTSIKGNKEKSSAVVTLAFLDQFESQFKSLGLDYGIMEPIIKALISDTVPTFVKDKGVKVDHTNILDLYNAKIDSVEKKITEESDKAKIKQLEEAKIKLLNELNVLITTNSLDFMAGVVGDMAPLNAVRGSLLVGLENGWIRSKSDLAEIVSHLQGENGFQDYAREQFEDNLKQISWGESGIPESLQASIYPHSGEFFVFLADRFEQMEEGKVLEIYRHLIEGQEFTPAIKDLLAEFEQSRVANAQAKLDKLRSSLQQVQND
jgi:hypothetical protein